MPDNQNNQRIGYIWSWQTLKGDWPLWLLIAVMFIAAVVLYPRLPEQFPSHWNIRGEVDATSTKPWGVFFQPLMTLGLYLMLLILPLVDPRRDNYARFTGTFRLFRITLVLFFAALFTASLAFALGAPLPMDRLLLGGTGALFALLGNSLGKIKPNYFVGIRTPWTIADEYVWRLTHRLAGKLWAAAGVLAIIGAFLPKGIGVALGVGGLSAGSIYAVIYSYLVWYKRK